MSTLICLEGDLEIADGLGGLIAEEEFEVQERVELVHGLVYKTAFEAYLHTFVLVKDVFVPEEGSLQSTCALLFADTLELTF